MAVPELPLEEFLQKAQVNQLTPDEFAAELQAQYGIDLTGAAKPYQQMGKVFGGAPEVPPGMRQKELSEELMEPVSQVAGIIGGAASKAADITKPFVREVVGLPNLKTPEELKATKEIRKQRQDIDKDFADRAGEPALERLRMDVRDNLEGILELVNLLRVTEDFTPKEYSTILHQKSTAHQNIYIIKWRKVQKLVVKWLLAL
jgi:hypothetical protein